MQNHKKIFINNNIEFLKKLHEHMFEENILYLYEIATSLDKKGTRPKMPIKLEVDGTKYNVDYDSSDLNISFSANKLNIVLILKSFYMKSKSDIFNFDLFIKNIKNIEITKNIKGYETIPNLTWILYDEKTAMSINSRSEKRHSHTAINFNDNEDNSSYCKDEKSNPYSFFSILALLPKEYSSEVRQYLFEGLNNTSFLDCLNLISDQEVEIDKQFLININDIQINNTKLAKKSNAILKGQ